MSMLKAGRAVLALGVVAGTMAVAAPAGAYGYWNHYYGYAPRPVFWPRPVVVAPPVYYAPYYRPPVVYAPPPVYAAPPVRVYAAPPARYAVPQRPVRRAVQPVKAVPRPSAAAPGRAGCACDLDSPFAGPGRDGGIEPVSMVRPQAPSPSVITPVPSPLPPPPAPGGTPYDSPFRGD